MLKFLNPLDLNNSIAAEINKIYFIRVPKSGSVSLQFFIKSMAKLNSYNCITRNFLPKYNSEVLTKKFQSKIVETVKRMEEPGIFISKHEALINFHNFKSPNPKYITLIREPVSRIISWFYYIRTNMYNAIIHPKYSKDIKKQGKLQWYRKTFDDCVINGDQECQYISLDTKVAVDYRKLSHQFCGNDKICTVFNSETVVQMAKRNVEKHFAVVGSWEDTNVTLTVLEHYLPRYFKNALTFFYENYEKFKSINQNGYKPIVSDKVRDIVSKNFTWEIEFYNFCKQRLYKQYIAIKMDKLKPILDPDNKN